MGDRAQVAIKRGTQKVYLYGHWIGSDIYKAVGHALRDVPGRHGDSEYLARAIFCRMIPGEQLLEETGFGIGVSKHGDIEHPIPVLDCETKQVTFEPAGYRDNTPSPVSFSEFAAKAIAGDYSDF